MGLAGWTTALAATLGGTMGTAAAIGFMLGAGTAGLTNLSEALR